MQTKDCFECGPSTKGSHCIAAWFWTNVKIYAVEGDPCPSIPSTLPTTLAAAQAIFKCKEPKLISSENNKCAGVFRCDGTTVVIPPAPPVPPQSGPSTGNPGTGGPKTGNPGKKGGGAATQPASADEAGRFLDGTISTPLGDARLWQGSLSALSALLPTTPRKPPVLGLRRVPEDQVLPEFAEILRTHAPLAAVTGVSADVTIEYPASPTTRAVTNRYLLQGTMLADGRFSFVIPMTITSNDAAASQSMELVAYDGTNLILGWDEAAACRVVAPSSAAFAYEYMTYQTSVRVLRAWVTDPLEALRLEGIQYQFAPGEHGPASGTIVEDYSAFQFAGGRGRTQYALDSLDGTPHVRAISIVDDNGLAASRTQFDEYAEVAPGVWRPFAVAQTTYKPRTSDVERVVRLHMLAAQALDAEAGEAALEYPSSANGEWIVFQ